MIGTLLVVAATMTPAVVALALAPSLTQPVRRGLFAFAWLVVALWAFAGLRVLGIRGVNAPVLVILGMGLVGVGALLCLDQYEGNGFKHAKSAPAGLPVRVLIAVSLCSGSILLAVYHSGALDRMDRQASQVLQVLTPPEFDPIVRIRRASVGDCVLGPERPSFGADRLVQCHVPHDWEVLSRMELGDTCPDADSLTSNVALMVVAHDLPHDRWCLAHSATSQRLTSRVCPAKLPCTE